MELQFVGKPIHCLQRVAWDVQEMEQTQEVRLPEDMPDIGSIVCAWGQCILRGKEWHSDKIGVNGGVMAWVLYIPADGSAPRWVEAWLPMQAKWNVPESRYEGSIRTNWVLTGVDGRMLSARKMLVRANAQALTEALAAREETVYAPGELPADVQLLKKTYLMELPKEAGEKTFPLEETLTVQDLDKPVSISLTPVVSEQLVVGGKAVFRGDARVHLVYQGVDGMLHSADREVPFSQFADLDRDYDKESTLCVIPAVSNLEMETGENGLQMKAALVMQYLVYDREQVDLFEDAYSNQRTAACKKQMLQLPMELDRMAQKLECETPVPVQMGQLADVTVFPRHCDAHRALALHEIENCGSIQMVYYDGSGQLQAETERYSTIWEIPGNCHVKGILKGVAQPRVEGNMARAGVELEAIAVCEEGVEMLTGLELGEQSRPDPGRPSLILRRAGEESLWQIAKESGSTVDAITAANGLESEPREGQMLLIPVV